MKIFNTSFVNRPMSAIPVDLNAYLKYLEVRKVVNISDPAFMEKIIRDKFGDCWGGYAEFRSYMWAGSYLEKQKKFVHLGIDITVLAGTEVRAPFDCEIKDILCDPDRSIGWGGRYVLSRKFCPNLVLGHLEPWSLKSHRTFFEKGEVIGTVGRIPTNGNVWPHLHVQCYMSDDLTKLDGYGHQTDLELSPNPYEVEWGNQ